MYDSGCQMPPQNETPYPTAADTVKKGEKESKNEVTLTYIFWSQCQNWKILRLKI